MWAICSPIDLWGFAALLFWLPIHLPLNCFILKEIMASQHRK